jgi:hypothetical protein
MARTATSALLLWLVTALSMVGFVAGFNIVVDPFGYFGTNSLGYYFSSERQFKFSLVRGYDYNAILLGDSRVAFIDASYITVPEYTFVNGGIGKASLAELVALLSASRLERLKLAIFGLEIGDLRGCSDPKAPLGEGKPAAWGWLRFAASWTQFNYAIRVIVARAKDETPQYHADGTRSVVSKIFQESTFDGKTPRYWSKIHRRIGDSSNGPQAKFDAKCRELLNKARALSDRYGFALMVVFLPTNSDLLAHWNWNAPRARENTGRFLVQVQQVVPYVVDLSHSSFGDSRNFWLNDPMHFRPAVGAEIIQEAIRRSFEAQASK